ncbi:prepilin peptidase [Candidatus Roizmanbacteria bacterium]|nr:prepilin peptidase [Candidatus Roizmanbacteria bacterium]
MNFLLLLFILGCAIGSFLNVLIGRLPNQQSILGRSHCDHCQKILTPVDLVPVLSFFWLKRRCRRCQVPLSWQYPLVELLTGLTFVFIGTRPGLNLAYFGIFSVLIVIFFADLKYQIIPDSMQFLLLLFSVIYLATTYSAGQLPVVFFGQTVAGTVIMLPILFLFLITKGGGMGFGDVKLSFIIGFMFGLLQGVVVLYLAFISGALIGIILLLSGRKKPSSHIAFGPFLVFGIIATILWGDVLSLLLRRIIGLI